MSYYPSYPQQPHHQQQDLQFQSFSYQDKVYGGTGFTPPPPIYPHQVTWASIRSAFSSSSLDNEPPLLVELGINFEHITSKGLTVLNPFKQVDRHIMDDTDLAGPLIFCFLFGGFLLLSGKAHFEYIYGVAVVGVFSIYGILNVMSETGIDGYRAASVLGYSLLPMVILSSINVLVSSYSK